MKRLTLTGAALAVVLSGCGGVTKQLEGRFASMPVEPDRLWKVEAWRASGGTTYLRRIPTPSLPLCAGKCPSRYGGGGLLVVDGRMVLDLGSGDDTGIYRSRNAAYRVLYLRGHAPDPNVLEDSLRLGRLTSPPGWVIDAERLVGGRARVRAHIGRGVAGLLVSPIPVWAGRRVLGQRLRTVLGGWGKAVFDYGRFGAHGYRVTVGSQNDAPLPPSTLRVTSYASTVDISAPTARERGAIRRLLRPAPFRLSQWRPPPG